MRLAPCMRASKCSRRPWLGETAMEGKPASSLASRAASSTGSNGINRPSTYSSTAVQSFSDMAQAPVFCLDAAGLPLADFSGPHPLRILRGFVARYCQGLPLIAREVLGQQHDLANMIWIVRQLAIDGLQHRMRLTANGDLAAQVVLLQWLQRGKHAGPSLFPQRHQRRARGRRIDKLAVAIA